MHSRLIREYQGHYGKLFQLKAQATDIEFKENTYVEEGVVRWKFNKRVPPMELLELWSYTNKPFDYEVSTQALKDQTKGTINQYKQYHVDSEEEIMEAKNELGNSKVVDVITGKGFN